MGELIRPDREKILSDKNKALIDSFLQVTNESYNAARNIAINAYSVEFRITANEIGRKWPAYDIILPTTVDQKTQHVIIGGRHFDAETLLAGLCVGQNGDSNTPDGEFVVRFLGIGDEVLSARMTLNDYLQLGERAFGLLSPERQQLFSEAINAYAENVDFMSTGSQHSAYKALDTLHHQRVVNLRNFLSGTYKL